MSIIIIDGNSVCHAAHNGPKLMSGNIETQAIFGMIRSVRLLLEKYPGWTPICLWDGRSQWRHDLYPEYKQNRGPKDAKQQAGSDSYKLQSPLVRMGLSFLGIRQLLVTTHEADDMAGLFSQKMSKGGNKIVLVTRDHDWLQLVNKNVVWYSPIDDYLIDEQGFTKFTGYFSTESFLQGKAIVGDTSDNIVGISRIAEGTAPKILAEFGSIEKFYEQCDSGVFVPRLVVHKNLNSPEGRAIFARNMKLMDLRNVSTPESSAIQNIPANLSETNFRVFCEKLAFVSILKDINRYMQPFVKLKKAA